MNQSTSPHAEAASQVTLRAQDLHKSYGRSRVLRGAELSLPAGRLDGVVGENGAGKTTLLRVLAGQLSPDSGSVQHPGGLGYCPQYPVLNPALTVDQHLRFFQLAYGLSNLRRAHEVMDTLNLSAHREQRVETLSGGTRQKLNLTIALMHDPPLLLLDEPYQGFDWETYQRFWDLAAEQRERGCSVLVVSHIAFDAAHFDRLWTLSEGRLTPSDRSWPEATR